jgi:hypothetical protein
MKAILLLLTMSLSSVAFGQFSDEREVKNDLPKEQIYFPDLLTVVPSFVGGSDSLAYYLSKNLYSIRKPLKYKFEKYTIYVRFIVDRDGTVTYPNISKKNRAELREAEIELIYNVFINMPKWNPGMLDGTPKKSYVQLPVSIM